MTFTLPHTITNCLGEKLTFLAIEQTPEGERVLVENWVQPGCGPVMHTHLQQDESLTVVTGKIGYALPGKEACYAGPGETVTFLRGVPHRFWNAGEEVLHCKGWIGPVHSIVFFLTAIFEAQNKSGKGQPEAFDGAYLMTRYKTEYEIMGIPRFVRKTIIPATFMVGRLLGKYRKFRGAPEPLPQMPSILAR